MRIQPVDPVGGEVLRAFLFLDVIMRKGMESSVKFVMELTGFEEKKLDEMMTDGRIIETENNLK